MNRYKAVFLDRDGTICRANTALWEERSRYMATLLGDDRFVLTSELSGAMFQRVSEQYIDANAVTTLEIEEAFWKQWYRCILEEYGITNDLDRLAKDLHTRFCFHQMKEPYPETLEVLLDLKDRGYKLGVISDTFPSLEMSLEAMGIAQYFETFISSSVVGVMKPDPKIYQAALQALNVEARDSIYVDDYIVESDGARDVGFTAFHLDRQQTGWNLETWTIGHLKHLVEYLDNGLMGN